MTPNTPRPPSSSPKRNKRRAKRDATHGPERAIVETRIQGDLKTDLLECGHTVPTPEVPAHFLPAKFRRCLSCRSS